MATLGQGLRCQGPRNVAPAVPALQVQQSVLPQVSPGGELTY